MINPGSQWLVIDILITVDHAQNRIVFRQGVSPYTAGFCAMMYTAVEHRVGWVREDTNRYCTTITDCYRSSSWDVSKPAAGS